MPSERKRPSAHAPKPATSGTKTLPEKIADFVLTHRGHFALALVRCNSARQRDGMLGVLRDRLSQEGVQLEILQLELHKVDDLLAWIRTATSGPQPAKADAFAITGLEGSLPSEGAPWTFAARLNLQRDAIAAEFGGPILLWLTDYATDLFMRVAPDLADYARLVLRVREPEVGALEEWATPRGIPAQSSQEAASPFSNQGLDPLHDRISELQRKGANASRAELLDLASFLSLAASRFEGTRDRRTGLPYLEQAGTIYRQLGIAEEQADVSRRAGRILHDAGDYLSAIQAFERALERVRKTGSRNGEAAILGDLGNCHRAIAALPKAIEYHEAALRIHRDIGLREGEATALGNLGICYAALGELSKAIEHHEAALQIAREIGSREEEASNLGNLGICYGILRDLQRSLEHHEAALRIHREIGSREGEASDLGNIGNCHLSLDEVQRAIEHYEGATRIHRDIGKPSGVAHGMANLGLCYRALGDLPKAIAHHEAALRIHREIGSRGGEATQLSNLGEILCQIGKCEGALASWLLSLAILEEMGSTRATKVREWIADLEVRFREDSQRRGRLSAARRNPWQVLDSTLKELTAQR